MRSISMARLRALWVPGLGVLGFGVLGLGVLGFGLPWPGPGTLMGPSPAGAESVAGSTPTRPEQLTLAPLRFSPHQVDKATLECGVPVFLFENHDLPLLDLTIKFRMGSRYLQMHEQAAATLLGTTWRSGGTMALPPDSLDERLAALDATITSQVGSRTGGVSLSASSTDLAHVLPLWRDVVLHPRLDADRLAKARANHLKDIQGMNDNPDAIAHAHWSWLVWGKDDPGAHVQTRSEIEGVTPEALADLHRRFVHPGNAAIGVSGDFDRAEVLRILDQLFGRWPKEGPSGPPTAEAWIPHPQPGVYLVRGEFEQSQIRMGRVLEGITRDSADFAAGQLLSYAFGWGRCFYRTREEGLSYGAAVTLDIGDERSAQRGFGSCRPGVTGRLIQALRDEMARLPANPLTADEVERARVFYIGQQVAESESAAGLVARRVEDVVQGRPEDYRERYLQQLQSATADDLARLARQHLTFGKDAVILVLGDPSKFDVPLDSLGLGPVKELTAVRFGE